MGRQEVLDWESEVSSRPCHQIPVGPWVSRSGPPFPHSYAKHTGPHIIQALRGSESWLGPGQGRSRVAWLRATGLCLPVHPYLHPGATYPVRDVVEAVWTGDVKAEEQDAGIRVEQGPQAVIVHLPW